MCVCVVSVCILIKMKVCVQRADREERLLQLQSAENRCHLAAVCRHCSTDARLQFMGRQLPLVAAAGKHRQLETREDLRTFYCSAQL